MKSNKIQTQALALFRKLPFLQRIKELLKNSQKEIFVKELSGSLPAITTASLWHEYPGRYFVLVPSIEIAENWYHDLQILVEPANIAFLIEPKRNLRIESENLDDPLSWLIDGLSLIENDESYIALATPDIFTKSLPKASTIEENRMELKLGQNVDYEEFIKTLALNGFDRREYVSAQGDLAVRGAIVDVFPIGWENPLRIEFFGNEIESIREFNTLSQRSIRTHLNVEFIARIFHSEQTETEHSIFDYIKEDNIFILDSPAQIISEFNDFQYGNGSPLENYKKILINNLGQAEIIVKSKSQPAFKSSINNFKEELLRLSEIDCQMILCADGKILLERFRELVEDAFKSDGQESDTDLDMSFLRMQESDTDSDMSFLRMQESDTGEIKKDSCIRRNDKSYSMNNKSYSMNDKSYSMNDKSYSMKNKSYSINNQNKILKSILWLSQTFNSGFILPENKIAVFTEHQIFSRLRSIDKRQSKRKTGGITLQELRQLNIGDFVVHTDKGIGKFAGFETVMLGGSNQDCVKLIYEGGDILYVHLNYIHKIQKYSSQEGVFPKLSKLGSAEWARKKARAKKKLKDIARDLIKLYAERKMQPGYSYPTDTMWQKEFEASFIYEDTPDQAQTTSEVKKDMEDTTPMDRLVCGDVGFGKTEIAVRAAFKAVQAGKQVAILVPTTILAQQHYMTFTDRLNRYPVNIDVISRFRSQKSQKKILEDLKKGKIDILIGTHRILSKDVEFKELGLLVIDEEHRFGVGSKEKLRQMRVSVDTLTLTATPIPRTLNFSLMGARDLSIIETPPRNRLPVNTEIIEWNDVQIKKGILSELERKGQAFFVSDKVKDLDKITMNLQMNMPSVRFGVAHGQMPTSELERVMERFIEGKYDVLVTTKIVESGLDIPNANTIFINRSHHFGLAELYQLRGRVGRSNKQAHCYLLIPPLKMLPPNSLRRLQAIEEFTELGSGFQLAMRDMEIRGAGNLLGPEQSGYINEIGFELFHKILDEAVQELRREEFSDLFKDAEKYRKPFYENEDIAIEIDTDALIPSEYIKNETERFYFYKKLYNVRTHAELEEISGEIQDRFGRIPKQVSELIFVVKLRISAIATGFMKVSIKKNVLHCEFPPDTALEYYELAFPNVMEYINGLTDTRLLQNNKKLILDKILTQRDEAVELLWRISKTIQAAVD